MPSRPDNDFEHGVERLIDQAEAQGFARRCSDPVVMARLAGLLAGVELRRRAARRSRAKAAA